jgi:hypothetical protein
MPRGIDAPALLAGYHIALEGQPIEALQSVVMKLVKGTWTEEVTFCPRPPELANMVREEARRIREATMPRIDYRPAERPPMVALMAKKYEGRRVLAENVEMGAFKPTEWPPGTCYVPILGKVFAPDETEKQKTESPSYQRYRKSREPVRSFHEPVQNVEYWEQIQAIRDAPTITDEQHALRRKIASSIARAQDGNKEAAE